MLAKHTHTHTCFVLSIGVRLAIHSVKLLVFYQLSNFLPLKILENASIFSYFNFNHSDV